MRREKQEKNRRPKARGSFYYYVLIWKSILTSPNTHGSRQVRLMLKSHPLVLTRSVLSHHLGLVNVAVDEMGSEHSYPRITRYMDPRESPPSRMLPVVGSSSQGSSSSPRLHYNSSSRSTSAKTLSTYRSCHRYASALLRPLRRLSDSEGMLLLDIIVSCF